jgi:hypothetical protein
VAASMSPQVEMPRVIEAAYTSSQRGCDSTDE